MKKFYILIILLSVLVLPVSAIEYTAPTVPDSANTYMPADTESFGEGLWYVIKVAVTNLQPDIVEAAEICISIIGISILISLLNCFSQNKNRIVELVGTLAVGGLLLNPSNALIRLGVDTVGQMSEYGKLLLPVMTGALAAQGAATTSTALYAGTALFSSLLSSAITKLLVPMVYIHLCLCVANSAIGHETIKSLAGFVKWLMTWCLKIILYIFTGYMGITGAVSGTADAAAIRATKLAISGFVPVVGSIISDASETILVGASVMKNAAGIYGLLAILAIWIGPFLKIGVQYIMLKLTVSICSIFQVKQYTTLIHGFCSVMGFILAMIGAVCLLLLVSTVCFMKGIS